MLLVKTTVRSPYEQSPKVYEKLQRLRAAVKADARFRGVEVMAVLCYDGKVDEGEFKVCEKAEDIAAFQGIVTLDRSKLRKLRIVF